MASMTARQIESDLAIHPGEFLAEDLEAREMTADDLSKAMGCSVQEINKILRGKKPLTAAFAVQLERVLGSPARVWLNLQLDYDLTKARQELRQAG